MFASHGVGAPLVISLMPTLPPTCLVFELFRAKYSDTQEF
jgi:hypothetical protein